MASDVQVGIFGIEDFDIVFASKGRSCSNQTQFHRVEFTEHRKEVQRQQPRMRRELVGSTGAATISP